MSRLPQTTPSLLRYLRAEQRQALRQAQSSPFAVPLAPGTISNEELATPVAPAAVNITATNFAVTNTWAEVVGVDVIVPAGCTQILLNAAAWVYAINSTGAPDNLQVRASLDIVNGQGFLTPLAAGAYNTVSAGLAVLTTGLTPGAVLRLSGSAKSTTGTFAANVANTATVVASLQWMR